MRHGPIPHPHTIHLGLIAGQGRNADPRQSWPARLAASLARLAGLFLWIGLIWFTWAALPGDDFAHAAPRSAPLSAEAAADRAAGGSPAKAAPPVASAPPAATATAEAGATITLIARATVPAPHAAFTPLLSGQGALLLAIALAMLALLCPTPVSTGGNRHG